MGIYGIIGNITGLVEITTGFGLDSARVVGNIAGIVGNTAGVSWDTSGLVENSDGICCLGWWDILQGC